MTKFSYKFIAFCKKIFQHFYCFDTFTYSGITILYKEPTRCNFGSIVY